MKRSFRIALLVIIMSVCCGCAASKDAAAPEILYDTVEDVEKDGAYSMGRSADPNEAKSAQEMVAETAALQEPLVYVAFSQYSGSASADDGTKLFINQSSIPEFVTEVVAVNEWLAAAVDTAAAQTADDMERVEALARSVYGNREEGSPADFYSYSYYSNVSTARLDSSVVSVLQVNSIYSGGAHPNYAQRAYNLDLRDCAELTLADVILPDGAEMLRGLVLTELEERFGGLEYSGLYADYPQVVGACFEDSALTDNWYFSGSGLVIYFNCYDIAPYAAGIIKVEIPYSALEGILLPEYYPERNMNGAGDMAVLATAEGRSILGTQPEGECLFVGTDQTVYDVKLHRIAGWLTDEVPAVGQMVLAANRMTAGEAVAIPAGDEAGYLLMYSQGADLVCKIVIDANGIREIVNEIAE